MPLHELVSINSHQAYVVWRIEELEEELLQQLKPSSAEMVLYSSWQHPKRRLEWLATRWAYQLVCQTMDLPYTTILKDANGRPYLAHGKSHVSLSHSFPFVAAALSQDTPIGIDLQIPSPKLQLAQEKYLNRLEIADSNQDLEKLCIYWCAKEAIYKTQPLNGLSLQAIILAPFEKAQQGTIQGQALTMYHYLVYYQVEPSYVLAWSQVSKEA